MWPNRIQHFCLRDVSASTLAKQFFLNSLHHPDSAPRNFTKVLSSESLHTRTTSRQ